MHTLRLCWLSSLLAVRVTREVDRLSPGHTSRRGQRWESKWGLSSKGWEQCQVPCGVKRAGIGPLRTRRPGSRVKPVRQLNFRASTPLKSLGSRASGVPEQAPALDRPAHTWQDSWWRAGGPRGEGPGEGAPWPGKGHELPQPAHPRQGPGAFCFMTVI